MSCAIELEIGPGSHPGTFLTRVVDAPAGGEPSAVFELDIEVLLRERDALENTVLASGATARRIVPAHEQQLRSMGRQLFEALFTERVLGTYRASLGAAQQRGEPLRVVLRLTAPQLAALPWEALFDPETEAYMCLREPLVRYVPAPYTREPLEITPPLRMLGLIAAPRGLPRLDVEDEQRRLVEALAGPIADGLIELEWLPHASWDGVHEKLLASEWHVLHFIGHGDYDVGTDQGQIALEGERGRVDLVGAEQLADLLNEARPTPRLVVLNSCSSGEQGTRDLFSATAAALVRSGINAVAAMQFTISDSAAISFARGFYTAIAHGRSVDDASRSGRVGILGRPRSLEWVTPVLYVRGETTQLFNMTTPEWDGGQHEGWRALEDQPVRAPSSEARPAMAMAGLQAMYVQARAELRAERYAAAMSVLDDLLSLHPGYRDAEALRDNAARRADLAEKFQQAVHAQTAKEWTIAAWLYGQVLELQSDYPGAAVRRQECEAAQRIVDLQDELRIHAESRNWQAVVDVNDELVVLDPEAADPDGLATHARAALAEALPQTARTDPLEIAEVLPPQRLTATTPQTVDSTTAPSARVTAQRRWRIAAVAAVVVVLVGATIVAVSQSSESPTTATSTPPSVPTEASTTSTSAPAPPKGPNETIADYLEKNRIEATPIVPGAVGAPIIDFPVPEGWTRIPDGADTKYFGVVFDTPTNPADRPTINATVDKLTGNVDTEALLNVAPGELENLPGYRGSGGTAKLDGQPSSYLGGKYVKDDVPRTVAQTSVVISGRDGPYLLQINAEGPEADFDALKAASLVIAERTTIRP